MVEKREAGAALVGLGIGGALGAAIAALLKARPAKAAPPDEKLDYLTDALTALLPALAERAEGIAPGIEVSVSTPWIAKDPEQIFDSSIRSAGTFYSDSMVDFTRGKRILFKVESSLNQPVDIQLLGNIRDDFKLATDVGPPLPCTANGNISVGLAWDDWHPYIGVKITAAAAPTAGILTISAVVQE